MRYLPNPIDSQWFPIYLSFNIDEKRILDIIVELSDWEIRDSLECSLKWRGTRASNSENENKNKHESYST